MLSSTALTDIFLDLMNSEWDIVKNKFWQSIDNPYGLTGFESYVWVGLKLPILKFGQM